VVRNTARRWQEIRRQLADAVLLFDGDDRTPAEIAEAALKKFGV
jgi:hypothetical protein